MMHTGLENYLQQEAFAKTLLRLYGTEGAEKARARCVQVMEGFYKTFDRPAEALFSAPGRTEIGGNHTDHQHGCVLAAAVDLDILAAAAPNDSGVIRVLSQGYPMTEVALCQLTPQAEEVNTSAALIRGVAARMSELGCDLAGKGLDVYMTSTVPKGSGLSSSAAYEVLIGTMLNELFWEGHCTAVELAQIGQYAENVFFGKPCGLMDQMASSVGGVVSIDFADTARPVVEKLDVDLHAYGYALCILDSGAGHEGLTDEYRAITDELRAVCRVFGRDVLREVPEADFLTRLPQVRAAGGDGHHQLLRGRPRREPRLPRLCGEPPRQGGKRGAGAGRLWPVSGTGAGVRALLRHVFAEHRPHRQHRRAGADGDHRPVRGAAG